MRLRRMLIVVAVALGGCTGTLELDARPSDPGVADGRAHFERGDFGLSERAFRAATEANPKSIDAWIGLAASYDRLARFELAERSYHRAASLGGKTPEYLNNLGYHYLLRGDRKRAKTYFSEALALDPGNTVIIGNLKLADEWKTDRPL